MLPHQISAIATHSAWRQKFGAAALKADGTMTYTPNAGFVGSDSMFARVTAGSDIRISRVEIEVYLPWTASAEVTGVVTTQLAPFVLTGGRDVPGGIANMVVELLDEPSFGSATTGPDVDRIWYTNPTVDAPTTVVLTYRLSNETGWSRQTSITLNVSTTAKPRLSG